MAGLAGENFRNRNPLILGLVGKHWPRDHIADGIDALHAGRKMGVDLDAAAIVERDAGLLEAEALGVGHAADCHQHHVGFQHF